nr:hypothetical protein Iba_chr10eCG8400 [Ipomoea batatas]
MEGGLVIVVAAKLVDWFNDTPFLDGNTLVDGFVESLNDVAFVLSCGFGIRNSTSAQSPFFLWSRNCGRSGFRRQRLRFCRKPTASGCCSKEVGTAGSARHFALWFVVAMEQRFRVSDTGDFQVSRQHHRSRHPASLQASSSLALQPPILHGSITSKSPILA